MSLHTSFRVGGPAELYLKPRDEKDLLELTVLLTGYSDDELPRFHLGGGANIVVADEGIDGAVIDLTELDRIDVDLNEITAEGGCQADRLSLTAAEASLKGAEFLAGMPGTVGGAVWMNARCYGSSVSDILSSVRYLDDDGRIHEEKTDPLSFDYKKSPFQSRPGSIILSARFTLEPGEKRVILQSMESHREDRRKKGHYRFPSAGSVFKNDRSLGAPTGVLLDSLGLKGLSSGDASVADFHANIIINRGSARAADIRTLVEECRSRARKELHIELEPEIRFVGKWSSLDKGSQP
jgi:UDP-N-acetylmuramate dehydrogenase